MSSLTGQDLTYLLLNVKNRNMRWDWHLSSREGSQQRRFTDTVVTNQTIPMAIRKRQVGISQYPLAADADIDILDLDVLGLAGAAPTKLQRVDGHVELLVALGVLGLVDELGGLILDRLEMLLALLGGDLPLRLLELLPVDLGLHLARVRGLQVYATGRHGEGGRHVALGADLDGLVEPLDGGWTPALAICVVGLLVLFNPLGDESLYLFLLRTG